MGLIMLVERMDCGQKDETVSLHGGGAAGLATGCFSYTLVVSALLYAAPQHGSERT